jgi:cytidine deaminase
MIERMENRDYVDKEHIIELEGHNAKIFFLKHSNSNSLKQVEDLLLDAYENRVCNRVS